jgi:hypothetical protein
MKDYSIVQKLVSIVGNDIDPSIYTLATEIFARLPEWPKDNEGDNEKLDLENFSILEIKETSMLVVAGGDWQVGKTFWVQMDEGDGFIEVPFKSELHNDRLQPMDEKVILNLFYPDFQDSN